MHLFYWQSLFLKNTSILFCQKNSQSYLDKMNNAQNIVALTGNLQNMLEKDSEKGGWKESINLRS